MLNNLAMISLIFLSYGFGIFWFVDAIEKVTIHLEATRGEIEQQNFILENQKEKFWRLAHRDTLTKLYNRRYFFERGAILLQENQLADNPVALLMIDIDHFKQINDQYGHQMGDHVLEQIGQLLQGHIRASDLAARLGGEEFCILLPRCPAKNAGQVAEKLRSTIAKTVFGEVDSTFISVTISCGICTHQQKGLDAMIRCADKLLYRAKEKRNCCVGE